jgi:hypothetical protein
MGIVYEREPRRQQGIVEVSVHLIVRCIPMIAVAQTEARLAVALEGFHDDRQPSALNSEQKYGPINADIIKAGVQPA